MSAATASTYRSSAAAAATAWRNCSGRLLRGPLPVVAAAGLPAVEFCGPPGQVCTPGVAATAAVVPVPFPGHAAAALAAAATAAALPTHLRLGRCHAGLQPWPGSPDAGSPTAAEAAAEGPAKAAADSAGVLRLVHNR